MQCRLTTEILERKLSNHNGQTNEPVKFKYSTMQPLKTLKPFELTLNLTDLSGNSPQIHE